MFNRPTCVDDLITAKQQRNRTYQISHEVRNSHFVVEQNLVGIWAVMLVDRFLSPLRSRPTDDAVP